MRDIARIRIYYFEKQTPFNFKNKAETSQKEETA